MSFRRIFIFILLTSFLPCLAYTNNVISISAGENKLDDAIFSAQPGDTIELTTNGGQYHEFFQASISIPLTIRAAKGLEVRPRWYCDDASRIIAFQNDLTLQGIAFVGSWGINSTENCLETDSGSTELNYKLKVENCDFLNFDSENGVIIKASSDSQADSVVISDCYFAHINGNVIDFTNGTLAPGSVKNLFLINCTFYDIGEGIINVSDNDFDVDTPGPVFYADHLTIHDPGMVNTDIKAIYPDHIDGAVILNSIVTRSAQSNSVFPAIIYGSSSIVQYLLTFNVNNTVVVEEGASYNPDLLMESDPGYFDIENEDFYLGENSPAVGFGENGSTAGDVRWCEPDKVQIDGRLGEWREWTKLGEKADNDPAICDSTELKAFWFTYDENKIVMRADFFGRCDWRGGSTSSPWNINSGAIRFYFYDQKGNKWRLRLYQNSIDSSFTSAKLYLESGPDFPGVNSGRISCLAQWNKGGTSVEVFIPNDSLTLHVSEMSPDSTIKARVQIAGGWGDPNQLPESGNFYFKLRNVNFNNPPVAIDESSDLFFANVYRLSQNFPNPFNSKTTISYSIPTNSDVKISIYDLLGEEVKILVEEYQKKGTYKIQWDATNKAGSVVHSGVYFYRISTDDFVCTKKLLFIK